MFRLISLIVLLNLNAYATPGKDWEFQEEKNGISVYKASLPGTKIAGARGVAIINSSIERVLYVLSDVKNAKDWVDRLKVSKLLEQNGPYEKVVYQEISLPWPLSNRDFVIRGRAFKDNEGRVIIELKSENHPLSPETTGVRGELIESKYILSVISENETKLEVEIFADPKGDIPTWLVNLMQKSWPVKTLSAIKAKVARPFEIDPSFPKTI